MGHVFTLYVHADNKGGVNKQLIHKAIYIIDYITCLGCKILPALWISSVWYVVNSIWFMVELRYGFHVRSTQHRLLKKGGLNGIPSKHYARTAERTESISS